MAFSRGKVGFPGFKPEKEAEEESELAVLKDIRHLLRVQTRTQVIGTSLGLIIVGVLLGLIVAQLWKYDVLTVENIDTLGTNIMISVSNITTTLQTIPATMDNVLFITNVLSAAMTAMSNATEIEVAAAAARAASGRHLLDHQSPFAAQMQVTNPQQLYNLTGVLLLSMNDKVRSFNTTGLSELVTWIVSGIQYDQIAVRYDKLKADIDATAKFSMLGLGMLGAAAQATGVNGAAVAQLLQSDFSNLMEVVPH